MIGKGKRFGVYDHVITDNGIVLSVFDCCDLLNSLNEEVEYLKQQVYAKNTLIDVCDKKFKEFGLMITVDDDGYVIE